MRKYKYTLTEILVVIAIIIILAGILFGATEAIRNRNAEIKTRAMMKQIQFGLEECKQKFGYYPVQDDFDNLKMELLFMKDGDDTNPGNDTNKKYSVTFKKACDYKSLMIEKIKIGSDPAADFIIDYYGYPLQYKSNGKSFRIYSKGLDGESVLDNNEIKDSDPKNDDNIYLD